MESNHVILLCGIAGRATWLKPGGLPATAVGTGVGGCKEASGNQGNR